MDFLETAVNLKTKHPTGTINYLDLDVDDSESGSLDNGARILSLKTRSKHIQLSNFRSSSSMSREMMQDISKYHGVDMSLETKKILSSEMDQIKYKELIKTYSYLAGISEESKLSNWKRFLRKVFPKLKFYDLYIDPNNREAGYSIVNKIIRESHIIGHKSRLRPGDFIICNSQIGSILMDNEYFVADNIKNNIYGNIHPNCIGSISNRIKVFVDPFMKFNDLSIIVGSNTQLNEKGVYLVEMEVENPDDLFVTFVDEVTMGTKIMINKRMAVTYTENSGSKFSKINISGTKRSLIRRILFI